jgi:hypothetical protein
MRIDAVEQNFLSQATDACDALQYCVGPLLLEVDNQSELGVKWNVPWKLPRE